MVHNVSKAENGLPGLVLEASWNEKRYLREILLYDHEFTLALCSFLRVPKGSKVQNLGELDARFEFFPRFL